MKPLEMAFLSNSMWQNRKEHPIDPNITKPKLLNISWGSEGVSEWGSESATSMKIERKRASNK